MGSCLEGKYTYPCITSYSQLVGHIKKKIFFFLMKQEYSGKTWRIIL